MAQPVAEDSSKVTIGTVALLAILRHTPLTMYEEDADRLTRVLVTAVDRLQDWEDRAVAFELLTGLVEKQSEAPKEHIGTIVQGATKAFTAATLAGKHLAVSGAKTTNHAAATRRQIVRLLAMLPTRYEHRYLLPLSASVKRLLSTACGDGIRQVREAAQLARENWASVQ